MEILAIAEILLLIMATGITMIAIRRTNNDNINIDSDSTNDDVSVIVLR